MDTIFRANVLFYEYVIFRIFERPIGFIKSLFKHFEIDRSVIFCLFLFEIVNFVYDIVIFPISLEKFGWIAVPPLTLGAGIFCWIMIQFYDFKKKDFLGIESVRTEMTAHKEKLIHWIETRPNYKLCLPFVKVEIKCDSEAIKIALSNVWIVEFLVCTFKWDAVVTTIYLREKSFSGLTRRDWKIFCASVLMSCLFWSAVVLGAIAVYECEWTKLAALAVLMAVWESK